MGEELLVVPGPKAGQKQTTSRAENVTGFPRGFHYVITDFSLFSMFLGRRPIRKENQAGNFQTIFQELRKFVSEYGCYGLYLDASPAPHVLTGGALGVTRSWVCDPGLAH